MSSHSRCLWYLTDRRRTLASDCRIRFTNDEEAHTIEEAIRSRMDVRAMDKIAEAILTFFLKTNVKLCNGFIRNCWATMEFWYFHILFLWRFILKKLSTICNFAYMVIFNILDLPGTQCPLDHNRNHLPVGLQVEKPFLKFRKRSHLLERHFKSPRACSRRCWNISFLDHRTVCLS